MKGIQKKKKQVPEKNGEDGVNRRYEGERGGDETRERDSGHGKTDGGSFSEFSYQDEQEGGREVEDRVQGREVETWRRRGEGKMMHCHCYSC